MAKSATGKHRFSLYKLNIGLRAAEGQEFKSEQRKDICNGNIANGCLKVRVETKVVVYKIEKMLKQI